MSLRVTTSGMDGVRDFVRRLAQAPDEVREPVAALIERQVERRIDTEKTSPSGSPWPAWAPGYQGRELLERSGKLLGSIKHVINGDTLVIGSDLPYAAAQNARRPFLGLSESDEREIIALIESELERLAA